MRVGLVTWEPAWEHPFRFAYLKTVIPIILTDKPYEIPFTTHSIVFVGLKRNYRFYVEIQDPGRVIDMTGCELRRACRLMSK